MTSWHDLNIFIFQLNSQCARNSGVVTKFKYKLHVEVVAHVSMVHKEIEAINVDNNFSCGIITAVDIICS